jgi:hypothetical protein
VDLRGVGENRDGTDAIDGAFDFRSQTADACAAEILRAGEGGLHAPDIALGV